MPGALFWHSFMCGAIGSSLVEKWGEREQVREELEGIAMAE
jgi:hypothetical protein